MIPLDAFYALLGLLQLILVGLGSWTLVTVLGVRDRLTKLETRYEAGVIPRIDRLEASVNAMEVALKNRDKGSS